MSMNASTDRALDIPPLHEHFLNIAVRVNPSITYAGAALIIHGNSGHLYVEFEDNCLFCWGPLSRAWDKLQDLHPNTGDRNWGSFRVSYSDPECDQSLKLICESVL